MIEYIGIDLGGTNIRVGAIDENENIIFEHKEPTFENVTTGEDLCNKMKKIIKMVPEYEKAKAIGIGVPGGIDLKLNQVISCKNIGIIKNYPLVQELKKEFTKPVYLENDARVAAFAEAINGTGKEYNNVSYVTVSTGLGGGTVINKKIYHGSNNLGSYFSRMILDGKNTSDYLVSGTALKNNAKNKRLNISQATDLFELCENGNETAKQIVEEFKQNLAVLFLNISATLNPEIIVLGGGVMNGKDYFLEDVKEKFYNTAHPLAKNTIIDVATFQEPGIIGACLIAKYN